MVSGRRAAHALVRFAVLVWVALTLNFALPRMAPGNVVDYLLPPEEGGSLPADQRLDLLRQFGLDRSWPVQYWRYLTGALRGDLGVSARYGRPVTDLLLERVGWTLLLVGTAALIATVLGTMLGFRSGWRRGSARDAGVMAGVLVADSAPPFFVGSLLMLVFAVKLRWFPTLSGLGRSDEHGLAAMVNVLRRVTLPLTTLVIANLGPLYLVARSAIVSELQEDYVFLAEAKGLSADQVRRHAQRNALLPVSTVAMVNLGTLVGGATVVETVFSFPGLGRLIYESVVARDYATIQGAALLLVLGVVIANLVSDLIYPLLDPRVRAQRESR